MVSVVCLKMEIKEHPEKRSINLPQPRKFFPQKSIYVKEVVIDTCSINFSLIIKLTEDSLCDRYLMYVFCMIYCKIRFIDLSIYKQIILIIAGGAHLKGHAYWLTLRFKDSKVESAFHHAEEAFSPLSLLGGPLVMICAAPVWRFQPWGPFTWGGIGIVVLFAVVLAGATCLGSAIKAMWLRRALALMMTFSLGIFLILDMVRIFIIINSNKQINIFFLSFRFPSGFTMTCAYRSYAKHKLEHK